VSCEKETDHMEKQRTLAGYLLAATLGSAFAPAAAQTSSFQGLGQMPGAAVGAGTYSSAISGDGSTIMGYG
jgi:hypothetical protein